MGKRVIIVILLILIVIAGVSIYFVLQNFQLQIDETSSFTLSGLTTDRVIVTEAIPKYETGKEVTDYSTAFNKEIINVKNGKATIPLIKSPVFIELDSNYSRASLSSYEDSPFGFHPANVFIQGYADNEFADATNIGVKWARQGLYVFWFMVQSDINLPDYDFTKYDEQWKNVPEDLNILPNIDIAPTPLISQLDLGQQRNSSEREKALKYVKEGSFLPTDEKKYVAFVRAAVERYDGDEVDDMPGLKNPIKYWQVGNEPPRGLNNYTEFLKLTYDAVKESCAECKVLIGGVPGMPPVSLYLSQFDNSYLPILNKAAELGKSFDIFDFHWYGNAFGEYKGVEDAYNHIKQKIDAIGIYPEEYWITEMGAYSGDPDEAGIKDIYSYQTESQQAGDYLKRFVFPLSLGIKKIFPAFGLVEGFKHNDGYFDHTGLIYNGEGSNDLGKGIKKLGYYTYKLMTEKLEGSEWDNVETISGGENNIYIYKFYRKDLGKPVYVAWKDYSGEESKQDTAVQKPEAKSWAKGKCGDGVCGPVEKEKGICPEDCEGQELPREEGFMLPDECAKGGAGQEEYWCYRFSEMFGSFGECFTTQKDCVSRRGLLEEATTTLDTTPCDQLFLNSGCVAGVAIVLGRMDICEELDSSLSKDTCYSYYAETRNDLSGCEKAGIFKKSCMAIIEKNT